MTTGDKTMTDALTTFQIVPVPASFVELVLKNREKIEALAAAGMFDATDGKATVHLKGGFVMGVQLETWTYQRSRELSTPAPIPRKTVMP